MVSTLRRLFAAYRHHDPVYYVSGESDDGGNCQGCIKATDCRRSAASQ
jgi:hypothetical protein